MDVAMAQQHASNTPAFEVEHAQQAFPFLVFQNISTFAFSLSYLASKAQTYPLSSNEWKQFMADTENLKNAFSALQSNSPSLAHSLMKNQTSFAGLSSPQAALSLALQNPVLFATSPSQQLLPQQQSVSKQTTSPSPPSPSSSPCTGSAGGRVSPHKKFRECAHCGTTKSSQWRRGPFKKAKLCNACGLRYSRNYAKRKQGKDKAITEARSDIYNLLN